MTATNSRACESIPSGKKVTPWDTAGRYLCCPRDRRQTSEGVCLVRGGHVCVTAAIVLLLGDDRWRGLHWRSRSVTLGLLAPCVNILAHYCKKLKTRACGSHWVLNPLKFGFLFVLSVTDVTGSSKLKVTLKLESKWFRDENYDSQTFRRTLLKYEILFQGSRSTCVFNS